MILFVYLSDALTPKHGYVAAVVSVVNYQDPCITFLSIPFIGLHLLHLVIYLHIFRYVPFIVFLMCFSCCKTNCPLEAMITDEWSWDELMFLPSAPSENNSQAPDVTAVAPPSRGPRVDLPSNATVRGMSRGQSRSSMMETADGNNHKQFFILSCVSVGASDWNRSRSLLV